MSDEAKPEQPAASESTSKLEPATTDSAKPEPTVDQPPPPPPESHNENDRLDLTNKARAFLTSPQVRNEDIPAKRRFLAEKGLTDAEINQLIQELVRPTCKLESIRLTFSQPPQVPNIPPRTYPQPPPSNLPNLLVGVFRILTWVAGGSAALLFVYMVRPLLIRLRFG
jgi:hypothetical protein